MTPAELLAFINETPIVQSCLYDINLLPEQLEHDSKEWGYMLTIAAHFRHALTRARELETAMKVVGPPDGKIDVVELLSQIANADLLRSALIKVREQREQLEARLAECKEDAERWLAYLKHYADEEMTAAEWKGPDAMTAYIDAARRKEGT